MRKQITFMRGAKRAKALLACCAPWEPVKHVIIYNVSGISQEETFSIMAEGKRVLSATPGAREVMTGHAVESDATFQYAWLVRACHPSVICCYRDHPAHMAFANHLFRPVAGNRIPIDYNSV